MARAAVASATGTARGTMQGSWRPWTESSAFSMASMSTVCCSRPIGGRRLYGHPPHDGCARGNAAQDSAGVIGLDLNLAGLGINAIRIVVLAAAHGGHGKAHAKLHTLYGGNAKRDLRYAVLDTVEHGVADARGKPAEPHSTMPPILSSSSRGEDLLAHAVGCGGVNAGQIVREDRLAVGLAIDHVVHGQSPSAAESARRAP